MQPRLRLYDDCQWQRGMKYWLFYGGLSLFVGVLDWIGWLSMPRGVLERISVMAQRPATAVSQSILSPINWLKPRQSASSRIADLESRLALAAVDQARLHELEAKVAQLESMVQTQPAGKRATLIAELLEPQDGQVWITAGHDEQVKPDQIVLDSHGVFIGKIGTIGRYTSQIVLPGDNDYRLAVQTSSGNAKGVIERIGSQVVLTSVLQTESLQEGDILVTSATDDSIIPRVAVAQVTRITGNPSDPTKGAEIILLASRKGWAALW